MGQQFPLALQVALYALSAAGVVLAAVLVHVVLRFKAQFERVVTATERLEAEVTPLARESRVAVARVIDLSARAGQQLDAVEAMSGSLLAPVRAVNRAVELVRTGATAFLVSLWNGRRQAQVQDDARVS